MMYDARIYIEQAVNLDNLTVAIAPVCFSGYSFISWTNREMLTKIRIIFVGR